MNQNKYYETLDAASNYIKNLPDEMQQVLAKRILHNKRKNNTIKSLKDFKSFIYYSSNKMAYKASIAISEGLNKISYNPFVIYGNTGLGKTHLLHAIANLMLQNGKTVIYITSEQFMNEFTSAIKNKTMEHFRRIYRTCDALLIDDIQFLSYKEQTQEELLNTLIDLCDKNKQIVVTSHLYPSHIQGLTVRLESRLGAGLVIKIEELSLIEKELLIKQKSIFINLHLDQEIVSYIAINTKNTVTSIEGILTKIKAYIDLLDKELNIDLVKDILKDKEITFQEIVSVVSIELHVEERDIRSTKRATFVINARKITIYLTKELTSLSIQTIADLMNIKKSSSINLSYKKSKELIKKDINFGITIDNLKDIVIKNKRFG